MIFYEVIFINLKNNDYSVINQNIRDMNTLLTIIGALSVIIIIIISHIYNANKTKETVKTKEKNKKDIKELNVTIAIKTTDMHKEGLDIIDFLCKTYNINSEKYQSVDEYKTTVLQNTNNKSEYWILCGYLLGHKEICIMPIYYFSEEHRHRHDDIIWFDIFSEFKKYIEDVKDENIT